MMNMKIVEPKVNITLGELFPELALPETVVSIAIHGITTDSRQIKTGDLFVALKGARVDAQQFISTAVAKGAVAVVCENIADLPEGSVTWVEEVPVISASHLHTRMSHLANQCYGNPSASINVVGVTGTNGKSTCVSLVAQLHQLVGLSAGSIGTLGAQINGEEFYQFGMTTPDAVRCQKLLAQMRDSGAHAVAIEVSSHGLDQGRVADVKFKSAIFTNISHDHLDYHGTLKNYAAAKQKLFEMDGLRTAIINLDDPHAPQMVSAAKSRANVLTYSLLHFAADLYATDMRYSTEGVEFRLVSPWGEALVLSPLLGEFNVYNLIAALTALVSVGVEFQRLLPVIPQLIPVPGRMQKVDVPADVFAVVDYAHTPDALAHAIAATRVHTSGYLWVVFGCGGDRDRTKRPVMAKIAERFADTVVVTSDNPRSEDAEAIIAEICTGFRFKEPKKIINREQAIHYAIAHAAPGDVILIAGKGHENYQIIGEQSFPFDDVLVAEAALSARVNSVKERREC